jgi:ParB family chromosome partitioning protein
MGNHASAAKAKSGTAKKRAPRRKKVEAGSKGLTPQEVAKAQDDGEALAQGIRDDGGEALAIYREPLGGTTVVLAALPLDKVEPTPYQRDRSEPHVKRLVNAMERVGRFLDPVICVRHDGRYWSPNGNHRLGAMKVLGAKTILGLVLPDPDAAYQILALNTEKAHNLKERSLEVIRMYRALVGVGEGKETDHVGYFEEPHFATFGACYEKRPRYSAGAYSPVVKRLERFLDVPVEEGLKLREARADKLLAWDDAVAQVVTSLKERGLASPYLKNYVVARVNYLRFKKDGEFDFDETIDKMIASTKKIDSAKIQKEDITRMGGGSSDSDEE